MKEGFEDILKILDERHKICQAWKAFLTKETIGLLNTIKAHGPTIGSYYDLQDMTVWLDATEEQVRSVVAKLQQSHVGEYQFTRRDIYDKTAYAELWLSSFVQTDMQCKLTLGIDQPMIFSVNCFRLEHRLRKGQRWARLYCVDRRLDQVRYGSKRWVAEEDFEEDAKREQMFEVLLSKVQEKGPSSLFTITQDDMVSAMITVLAQPDFYERRHLTAASKPKFGTSQTPLSADPSPSGTDRPPGS